MSDSVLSRALLTLTDEATLQAAHAMVESDSVFLVSDETQDGLQRIEAVVASAETGKWYERPVVETWLDDDGTGQMHITCSCGAAPGCVHAAATILASGDAVVAGLPGYRRARETPVVEISAAETTELAPGTPAETDGDVSAADETGPELQLNSSNATGDWFDLKVTVTIEGEEVNFADLFAALSRNESIFVLPSGTYFPLDSPELDQLRSIIEEAASLNDQPSGSGLRLSRYQSDLWEQLGDLGVVAQREHQWWESLRQLSDDATLQLRKPPAGLHATLRDYQVYGYSWLRFLYEHRLGGILADEMGLGKTLQTLAMIQSVREDAAPKDAAPKGTALNETAPEEAAPEGAAPFLILAPTSVVGNWKAEAHRFTPSLEVVVISETAQKSGEPLAQQVQGADIVITSYALFRLEEERYRELDWAGLILDEAQMIKNHASRGHRAARGLNTPFTLAITGTPLENNLMELWALAALTCPGLLGRRERFIQTYQNPIEKDRDAGRLATLRRRLRPFLLRRTKEAVATELPPKQEQVLSLELHPDHRELYDRRLQRERAKILGLVENVSTNRFEIFRSLTTLRQLALDAELAGEGTAPSVKLEALGELLEEVTAEGHRVLVLSQFTRFLKKARATADERGIASAYLDGATAKRQDQIDAFRAGEREVFFISLKAGGFGLNLVEADYVILLDPWWNPAAEAQAIDRAHRIGQTRSVMVYRLIAANTIESKVMALQKSKHELFSRVLEDSDAAAPVQLSADDIRQLLQ
ncbi:DEAD/DEAH box helicase [Nesterenkonia massiliensis]|uniref:DEAD/DEAH box helicase n=1 Tax=Nesterenkonia massiliensis TaxID=1232429 RepID=UPI0003FEB559|nr:DEAD/DEAH box helicase [Nesterenkonia massiliensis]